MLSVRPYVEIIEQPASKSQRFRYLSEVDGARSVGSIPGVSSTADRRTYPAIKVHGYRGPFVVLLSLLNPNDNLVHPHSITGSDTRYSCKNGVIFVISNEPEVVFKNIGILCVKGKTEKDVTSALELRRRMEIDPFGVGFKHLNKHSLINFTAVRLCFQVFLPGRDWTPADRDDLNKYSRQLKPVASDIIYDAKKLNDLKIVNIPACCGPLTGETELTLLCDKYTGQNPDVVFEDGRGWMQTARVKMHHKQLAIVFYAPAYEEKRDPRSPDYLKVNVYLQQMTDRGTQRSQTITVEYLPNPQPNILLKQVRKQQRPPLNSPEDERQKRGRTSEENQIISHIDRALDNTALDRNERDGRAETIPLFDPNKSELLTREWISKIDHLGSKYNWSDTVKAYYMQKRLSGSAKEWLSSIRDSDHLTWPEWKEKLLQQFSSKVDYLDLLIRTLLMLKEMKEKSEKLPFYNESPLPERDERNIKKAYACLIDGWPLLRLQSPPGPPGHWKDDTRPPSYPEYHYRLDRDDRRNFSPHIHPMNSNIVDHKLYMDTLEDVKPLIHPNLADYRLSAKSPDQKRGEYCCCNNCKDEVRVIKRCPPSRQNEDRPSCIQRNQKPQRSWHQPCWTFTGMSEPLLPDQRVMKNAKPESSLFRIKSRIDCTMFESPGYTEGIKEKASSERSFKRSPSALGEQPVVVNQNADIKMSPPSYQEFGSPIAVKEFNASNWQDKDLNAQGYNMMSYMNGHPNVNRSMTNNIVLPSTSRVNNVPPGQQRVIGFPQEIKIKRSASEHNDGTLDSGEQSPKREKSLPPAFHPQYDIPSCSSYPNLNNPTAITNMPPPISFPIRATNPLMAGIVSNPIAHNGVTPNNSQEIMEIAADMCPEPSGNLPRSVTECYHQLLDGIDPSIVEPIPNENYNADTCNYINNRIDQMIQSNATENSPSNNPDVPNVNYNISDYIPVDFSIDDVSEEMKIMHVSDKLQK